MLKKLILSTTFLLVACSNPVSSSVNLDNSDWLINTDYVRQGCFSGKDCIPSLESPGKSSIDGANLQFLDDNDLVVGIWNGQKYVAYPHSILDWHEIVNEEDYTISYCPLTGSALHFETKTEFGVSGMLYNSNLIMYDRDSDSYWPQMFLGSASGEKQGDKFSLEPMLETTWKNWKTLFPNSMVVNSSTGYARNYDAYPYGRYKSCNSEDCGDFIYFPVETLDDRLPAKERVLSIITKSVQKAYVISSIATARVINETIAGENFAIVISGNENIAIAFEANDSLSIQSWNPSTGLIILADTQGNQWNILGKSLNNGTNLKAANSFISYWFSQAAFYPKTQIYK
ncbi:MAG: DUF3179 domain-containing protein [Candidatus Marinimicrobia bacterium]|jgi:hypothetical protein|nr:DUF3179 domain-containing protein [Candidatus Neomarinimicrobiota bacterium]MBT3676408.1 DUF3179 domain-containing protein [Candidatus Neomarinimicrobiota bacterium]MBT3763973.1 DUF3179 domain-containing protein [Candidatus Neomarinimicrobiota bacterium]MBT4270320.1 DUF3179 domain-containing protein [Candidatus Neomarinimicrobiota bacterium]MBT4453663.1 DUF3179 domain-containing protein [Candidatus Neomarinimicrobiota bacterium]